MRIWIDDEDAVEEDVELMSKLGDVLHQILMKASNPKHPEYIDYQNYRNDWDEAIDKEQQNNDEDNKCDEEE